MGTSNFSRGNTSKVFAVLMNREENFKECSECGEIHHDYEYNEEFFKNLSVCSSCGCEDLKEKFENVSPDEWEYDELKDYIKETAQEEVKELKTVWYKKESGSDNDRNYCATDLFSFNTSKSFGDVEVSVKIIGQIVSAYYEGASLDFAVQFNDEEYTNDSPDFEWLFEYNSDMNKGLQKIQIRNAEKWAENEAEKLKELIEEVFTEVSMPLVVTAQFSNGETFYAKAE